MLSISVFSPREASSVRPILKQRQPVQSKTPTRKCDSNVRGPMGGSSRCGAMWCRVAVLS